MPARRRTAWILAALALGLGLAGALLVPGPRWDAAIARCRERFAAAPSAADSARVARERAFQGVQIRRSGMTCGDLRRGGRLEPSERTH